MISYYFPPLAMGGAQRPAKFARYLPDFGWDPTVLTVKPIAYWAQDPQLLEELEGLRIVRTESLDPQRLLARLTFNSSIDRAWTSKPSIPNFINETLLPLFLVPDPKILWWPHLSKTAHALIEHQRFDVILTTSPPHSTHLLGKKLAQKYALKWVADFRDSWSGGVVVREPGALHRGLNRKFQESVVREAAAVITVSNGIRRELERVSRGNERKVHLIPNGYDDQDYPARASSAGDNRFVFCHCGAITRFSDPGPLLVSLERLLRNKPELGEKIRFQFVGYDATGTFLKRVSELRLEGVIDYLGHQPHRMALQHVMDAQALVLISQGPEGAHFVPGKTFEYLGAGKPILAITNVQDTIDLLQQTKGARIVGIDQVDKIGEAVTQIAEGRFPPKSDPSVIRQFGRKFLTGKLAEILGDIQAPD